MMAKVEIYGTSFCRHCLAARQLLDSKQIDYTEYLIDLMPLERAGDEDLMVLDASGELDRLKV